MRFLLKCVFWLGGVFLIMPGIVNKSPDAGKQAQQQSATQQSNGKSDAGDPVEQWLQAGRTLQDIAAFCDRNPALCTAGKAALLEAGQQAGENALNRAKTNLDSLTHPAQAEPVPASQKIPLPAQRPLR